MHTNLSCDPFTPKAEIETRFSWSRKQDFMGGLVSRCGSLVELKVMTGKLGRNKKW
jgi:hypothetical protein